MVEEEKNKPSEETHEAHGIINNTAENKAVVETQTISPKDFLKSFDWYKYEQGIFAIN